MEFIVCQMELQSRGWIPTFYGVHFDLQLNDR